MRAQIFANYIRRYTTMKFPELQVERLQHDRTVQANDTLLPSHMNRREVGRVPLQRTMDSRLLPKPLASLFAVWSTASQPRLTELMIYRPKSLT